MSERGEDREKLQQYRAQEGQKQTKEWMRKEYDPEGLAEEKLKEWDRDLKQANDNLEFRSNYKISEKKRKQKEDYENDRMLFDWPRYKEDRYGEEGPAEMVRNVIGYYTPQDPSSLFQKILRGISKGLATNPEHVKRKDKLTERLNDIKKAVEQGHLTLTHEVIMVRDLLEDQNLQPKIRKGEYHDKYRLANRWFRDDFLRDIKYIVKCNGFLNKIYMSTDSQEVSYYKRKMQETLAEEPKNFRCDFEKYMNQCEKDTARLKVAVNKALKQQDETELDELRKDKFFNIRMGLLGITIEGYMARLGESKQSQFNSGPASLSSSSSASSSLASSESSSSDLIKGGPLKIKPAKTVEVSSRDRPLGEPKEDKYLLPTSSTGYSSVSSSSSSASSSRASSVISDSTVEVHRLTVNEPLRMVSKNLSFWNNGSEQAMQSTQASSVSQEEPLIDLGLSVNVPSSTSKGS